MGRLSPCRGMERPVESAESVVRAETGNRGSVASVGRGRMLFCQSARSTLQLAPEFRSLRPLVSRLLVLIYSLQKLTVKSTCTADVHY